MAMLAFEINKRQPLAEGRSFGATGAYGQIDGIAHFGVDPAHPDNRGITDVPNPLGRERRVSRLQRAADRRQSDAQTLFRGFTPMTFWGLMSRSSICSPSRTVRTRWAGGDGHVCARSRLGDDATGMACGTKRSRSVWQQSRGPAATFYPKRPRLLHACFEDLGFILRDEPASGRLK
jgi:hypothetical protein